MDAKKNRTGVIGSRILKRNRLEGIGRCQSVKEGNVNFRMKDLYRKYKDVIPYMFFGVCTTIVNVAAYWISAHLMYLPVMVSTIIAWFLAVLFAYITNRKWVFHSKVRVPGEIMREMVSFFMCRLVTGVVDWMCMFFLVGLFGLNDVIIKFIDNVVVIILNYVASKLVIFRNRGRVDIHEEK